MEETCYVIIPFFKGAGKTITNTATCTDGSCTTTTAEEANTLGIIIINETNGSNNNNVAMATAGRRKKSMYSSTYIYKQVFNPFSQNQKPRFPPDLSLFHATFWKEKLFRDVLLPYLFIFRHINFFFWRLIKQGFPHKRLEVALCGKI